MPSAHDPAELLARLHQAEAAVRARDDFLAIAAHELRSPLSALALRLRALERLAERASEPALQDGLERAARSVDRYVRRAVTLLDLSRMQAGVLVPAPAQVSGTELLRNVVDAYRDEAAFHGARLDSLMRHDVTGWWDAHMVEQVLANLVSNAIKYGNGSPVRVSVGLAGPGMAAFEVEDGGPGIAAADRARIFEKFERVVSAEREQAGYGLGLWIAGRMVAAHHGAVEIVDGASGGTLFRVTLPLQPSPEHQKDPIP